MDGFYVFVTLLSALLSLSLIFCMFTRGARACVCVTHAVCLLIIYTANTRHVSSTKHWVIDTRFAWYSCSRSLPVLRVSLTIFRHTRHQCRQAARQFQFAFLSRPSKAYAVVGVIIRLENCCTYSTAATLIASPALSLTTAAGFHR